MANTGTLRLLLNRTRARDDISWAQALAWDGYPPDASWADVLDDVDLGDYDCTPLPSMPPDNGRGLWLLVWEWREVKHPEWEGRKTAKYAKRCEWRRPTLADLVALGAVPAAVEG